MSNTDAAFLFLLAFAATWFCGFMSARSIYLPRVKDLQDRIAVLRVIGRHPPAIKSDSAAKQIFWGRN